MKVVSEKISVSSRGHADVVDLSAGLEEALERAGLLDGTATLFVAGATAALSTIEFEPGACADIRDVLEQIVPERHAWKHHATWGDDNGAAHVRACLMGPSLTVPVIAGKATLGTWQQVVLLDFDTRPRDREIIVQCLGVFEEVSRA